MEYRFLKYDLMDLIYMESKKDLLRKLGAGKSWKRINEREGRGKNLLCKLGAWRSWGRVKGEGMKNKGSGVEKNI